MIEKYIGQLPGGINLTDILSLLVLILIITHIIGSFNRKRLKNEVQSIPGYDINQKLISDISQINRKIENITSQNKETELNILNLQNKDKDMVNIKSFKYNPYEDMGVGGKQSFSISFLDEYGNGTILTNLYSRERSRVLLKEIKNWKSEQKLTPEENEVLAKK